MEEEPKLTCRRRRVIAAAAAVYFDLPGLPVLPIEHAVKCSACFQVERGGGPQLNSHVVPNLKPTRERPQPKFFCTRCALKLFSKNINKCHGGRGDPTSQW